jgi:hypothetical protein
VPKLGILTRHYKQRIGYMAFVRKKRLGGYEYYQLVENRWIDGKPRQRVLLHLGRYSDVEAALKEWPGAIQRLGHFAQRKREEADRFSENPVFSARSRAAMDRAEKAERRAGALAANLKKLHHLKDQGVV